MSELERLLSELDARIQELEKLPYPAIRDQVFEALQLVDLAHRPGLTNLHALLEEAGLLDRALEDEAVRLLLTLYDLAPLDPVRQAEVALEAVRPYIESHGGEVEVLEVDDGEVHVRLAGACGSCAASPATLRNGVEVALAEGLPGFTRLVVHEPEPAPASPTSPELVQIGAPAFSPAAELDALTGAMALTTVDGRDVLLVREGDSVRAYDPICPTCRAPLADGKLTKSVLLCPFQNCAYDAATGRRVDGIDAPGLKSYPTTIDGGRVLVAGGVAPAEVFAR